VTLLDEAARLRGHAPTYMPDGEYMHIEICAYCFAAGGHEVDCPWLKLPLIHEALDIAQKLAAATDTAAKRHALREQVPFAPVCACCDEPWPCQVALAGAYAYLLQASLAEALPPV